MSDDEGPRQEPKDAAAFADSVLNYIAGSVVLRSRSRFLLDTVGTKLASSMFISRNLANTVAQKQERPPRGGHVFSTGWT